jgi:anti-sigma factor RsiW
MSPTPPEHDDRRLWQRYTAARTSDARQPIHPPDELDLAAFLDGTASEDVVARVEQWLQRDPTAANEIHDLRSLLARQQESPAFVPTEVAQRAKALVSDAPAAEIRVLSGVLARVAGWSVAAAAMVAIATVGYQGGLMAAAPMDTTRDVTDALSFGLADVTDVGDLDLLWPAAMEASP